MKSTIFLILLITLPSVIHSEKFPQKFVEEVFWINDQAHIGTEINNALLLKPDGFLGEGSYGFVYEGITKEDNRTVAIKFFDDFSSCYREIELFCYLKAYKNASVEIYGIPAVYYYGRWKKFFLIAFTKFDMNLSDVANDISTFSNELDVLILLRDFIFQSKYMHSCGVRHDDVKPENIMLRGSRSFLIDFNSGSKMMEDNLGGTRGLLCKRYNTGQIRRAIDDYETFLYTISLITRRNWFESNSHNKSKKKRLGKNGLEKIIRAFADEVFTDNASKRFPDYNKLEKIVSRVIKKLHPNGAPTFSWLAPDAETSPERKITDIDEPKSIDFNNFDYPPVVQLSSVGSSQQPTLPSHTSVETTKSKKKVLCCL